MNFVQPLWGPAALQAGLHAVGYPSQQITAPGGEEFVVFDFTIDVGPRAGQLIKIGLQAPPDFPITPPGGPHLNPRLGHPDGAVHASSLGDDWEYWSRPAHRWTEDSTTRGYLRHLRSILARCGTTA